MSMNRICDCGCVMKQTNSACDGTVTVKRMVCPACRKVKGFIMTEDTSGACKKLYEIQKVKKLMKSNMSEAISVGRKYGIDMTALLTYINRGKKYAKNKNEKVVREA